MDAVWMSERGETKAAGRRRMGGWLGGRGEVGEGRRGDEGGSSLSRLRRRVSSGFMQIGAAEPRRATPPSSNTSAGSHRCSLIVGNYAAHPTKEGKSLSWK